MQAIRERDEERLRVMSYYCITTDCLREYILRYFGEKGGDCGNCSNCCRKYQETDMSAEAGQVIQCIREQGGRYGINVVTGTLMGADTTGGVKGKYYFG